MQLRLAAGTTLIAFLLVACGSSSSGDDDSHASGGTSGMSAMDSTGGTGAAGTASGAGTTSAGGSTGSGRGGSANGAGGGSTAGSSSGGGGSAGKSAMDSGAGGMPAEGGSGPGAGGRANGSSGGADTCAGGMGCAGRGNGRGGRGGGAAGASAGTGAGGAGSGGAGSGGESSGVNPMGGFAGASPCPGHGDITYTLRKSSNPTSDEQKAYDLITTAMDRAVQYYDCYTNITKAETVVYDPSVSTADGNSNGSIRFGQTPYMEYITAMHEIAHTVGVGTDSKWPGLVVNGVFTGQHATEQLRAITGNPSDELHADTQHFWPYGLNYTSEVKSEADVVDHCLMVVAIRWDMGYAPN